MTDTPSDDSAKTLSWENIQDMYLFAPGHIRQSLVQGAASRYEALASHSYSPDDGSFEQQCIVYGDAKIRDLTLPAVMHLMEGLLNSLDRHYAHYGQYLPLMDRILQHSLEQAQQDTWRRVNIDILKHVITHAAQTLEQTEFDEAQQEHLQSILGNLTIALDRHQQRVTPKALESASIKKTGNHYKIRFEFPRSMKPHEKHERVKDAADFLRSEFSVPLEEPGDKATTLDVYAEPKSPLAQILADVIAAKTQQH